MEPRACGTVGRQVEALNRSSKSLHTLLHLDLLCRKCHLQKRRQGYTAASSETLNLSSAYVEIEKFGNEQITPAVRKSGTRKCVHIERSEDAQLGMSDVSQTYSALRMRNSSEHESRVR